MLPRRPKNRPHQAKRKANLAARGPRQKLAQSYEISEGLLVQPAAAHDEFLAEIAQMRNRTAEGGQAKPEEAP